MLTILWFLGFGVSIASFPNILRNVSSKSQVLDTRGCSSSAMLPQLYFMVLAFAALWFVWHLQLRARTTHLRTGRWFQALNPCAKGGGHLQPTPKWSLRVLHSGCDLIDSRSGTFSIINYRSNQCIPLRKSRSFVWHPIR